MQKPAHTGSSRKSQRVVVVLWGLALAFAGLNQAIGAAKSALPQPMPQKERTLQEAAAKLKASPPPNGKTLVLLGLTDTLSEDSMYFAYRLQYAIYPLRVDRVLFPWNNVDAESYQDIYLCDELYTVPSKDIDSHSGTIYKVRTPISTARLRGETR